MADPEESRRPDTTSVSLGHDAIDHLGSLKTPLYETSTFVFETAEEGKRFFEVAYGLDEARPGEKSGYIYSRLDSPNLRVVEARIAAWEGSDDSLLFNSGMAAISTLFLTFLRPGDVVLYSTPAYGGTTVLLKGLLSEFGVEAESFTSTVTENELMTRTRDLALTMIYVETPANPTNDIFDIEMVSRVAKKSGARVVVDNTFLTPVWQKPLEFGADLVVHSATKYLGGHSDLTAGVVCGSSEQIEELRHTRYQMGATAQPSTAWMLTRSLETLLLRVVRQTENATTIARFLSGHDKVASVNHLSLLTEDDPRWPIYDRQCSGPGAMISFEVVGGEAEAFRFLNAMKVINLTVSLGGTESLASHPWSMSHSTMPADEKKLIGVSPGLIRFSVGVENVDDLISDLDQALKLV